MLANILPPYRSSVIASFAGMFLMGAVVALLGPCLPGIAQRTHTSLAQVAVLFTAFAGGSLVATLLMTRLADRPARHAWLVGGSLLVGGMLWTVTFTNTLAWTAAAIALAGFGMSSAGVSPNVIIAEIYGRRAPSALNALHTCVGLGSFVSPLAVGLVLQRGGDYTLPFRLIGTLEFVAAALWFMSRPPRPPGLAGGQLPSIFDILPPVVLLVLFAMLYVGAEQTIGGWMFAYATDSAAFGAAAAGLVTALFWLAMIVGRMTAVPALRSVSTVGLLVAGVLTGLIGVLLVIAAGYTGAWLWVGAVVVGFAFGPLFPTTLAAGTQLSAARMGLVSSLLVAAGSVGTMVLPWAGGLLIPRSGPAAPFFVALVALGLMLLILWALAARQSQAAR